MPLKSKEQAFHEFKRGKLRSGRNGKIVKSKKQAVAIALNADRRAHGRTRKSRSFSSSRSANRSASSKH